MILDLLKKIAQIFGINYLLTWIQRITKLPSVILLILVNLIPIFGVFFLKWNSYDIVVLYWVENIVIGICTIPKILFAQVPLKQTQYYSSSKVLLYGINIFLVFFFMFHYGMFMFGHSLALQTLIFPKSSFFLNSDYSGMIAFFFALIISHGFSLFTNYFLKGEYKNTNSQKEMLAPYSRIMVMQLTIILGIIIILIIPDTFIVFFVLLKTLFDSTMHIKSHYSSFNQTI